MTGTLVACFSATGTTLNIAQIIAKAADADLYQIIPKQPYTKADLDWMDRNSRSSVEMKDSKFRPQIKDQKLSLENYDVIYLGFPIWWIIIFNLVFYVFLRITIIMGICIMFIYFFPEFIISIFIIILIKNYYIWL